MSKRKVPAYSLHKPTGQARVRLNGRDVYLGRHGTKVSKDKYRQLISEWLASQRLSNLADGELTIVELMARYLRHGAEYYGDSGEVDIIKSSLRPLRELYGALLVDQFSPLKLKAVREAMIYARLTRTGCNKRVDRIRRMFRWGVENELVSPITYEALRAVRGLGPGRSKAPEAPPVKPVDDSDIDAITPYVSPQVWTMVQLQRLSGMRPGEVIRMRLADIDQSESVWVYRPPCHKNQWRGHERPKATSLYRGVTRQREHLKDPWSSDSDGHS